MLTGLEPRKRQVTPTRMALSVSAIIWNVCGEYRYGMSLAEEVIVTRTGSNQDNIMTCITFSLCKMEVSGKKSLL